MWAEYVDWIACVTWLILNEFRYSDEILALVPLNMVLAAVRTWIVATGVNTVAMADVAVLSTSSRKPDPAVCANIEFTKAAHFVWESCTRS